MGDLVLSPMYLEKGNFGVQDANYLTAWNCSIYQDYALGKNYWMKSGNIYQQSDQQPLPAENYAIELYTREYTWEEIRINPDLGFKFKPGDPYIDEQLIKNAKRDGLTYSVENFTYRLEGVERFTVRCDKPIFGQEPDVDISDKFVIFGGIIAINREKQYLGRTKGFLPLKDYMNLRPLVFNGLDLTFNRSSIPEAKLEDCRFDIEIELDNGKVLNASTFPVTFI
ncbi:MAG: hypothetical protein MJZ09_07310 [Bacteroidales bacterium]|nr:hypothetical protein [Bacteroidales bacterium]